MTVALLDGCRWTARVGAEYSATALALLLTGCASQGPLRPPSLHLPAQVREVHAERTGDVVDLQWTNPTRTSDGVSLTGKHGPATLTAEVCRVLLPGGPCPVTARIAQVSGQPGSYHDHLPPELATGPARVLTYRVRMLNAAGSGLQPVQVDALAGFAPHLVQGLTAEPANVGVALHWQADPDAAADRVLIRAEAAATANKAGKPTLLAVEPASADPGGALDMRAQPNTSYSYSVVRTRTMHRAGAPDLSMSSAPASTMLRADARPKALPPPRGLEAVVNSLGTLEVALVWEPGEGAVGYLVFRAGQTGEPVQLTASPVQGFTYVDNAVQHGRRYRYSIAAVDRAGQVGPRCAEQEVTTPAE